MMKKPIAAVLMSFAIAAAPLSGTSAAFAAVSAPEGVTMENCGAYLFTWRPVDCGNGRYFAILVGGNTINEGDVILNRGYDYAYTFNPSLPRPWGEVPELVNVNGVWAIPENQALLPEGTQPVSRIVLITNNKNSASRERYVDVVRLPGNVSSSELPPEVRKYLINTNGSDAGAYVGTQTPGWTQDNGQWRYRRPDGTYVSGGWLSVDDEQYYMTGEGYMLADTVTPDGYYVNASGERQNYIPGWQQTESGWRYLGKNGYYASSRWFQDADGRWYYFNMAGMMMTDSQTPDGYYVDADGVWDGQPAAAEITASLGPGAVLTD